MTPLTDSAVQKIDALFPPASRARARQLLEEGCGANLTLYSESPWGFDRIRFAVLKNSGGDMVRLEREVAGANIDWRDTLMTAGFESDIHAHRYWNPTS